jgi:hypothetical protein
MEALVKIVEEVSRAHRHPDSGYLTLNTKPLMGFWTMEFGPSLHQSHSSPRFASRPAQRLRSQSRASRTCGVGSPSGSGFHATPGGEPVLAF